MTSAAQQLITAPIARKLMSAGAKKGDYFPLPTMADVEQFYFTKKGWWSLRDAMVRKYNSMTMLEPPLGNDKDGQQDLARNNEEDTGRDDYSIDPSPFDTVTQAISMAAKLRAYANTYPTDEKHTPAMLLEYGKYGNAVLDMESKKGDYIPADMARLINTGWLIKLFPFDQQLQDQGKFPFRIETLSPLGVYPELDIHNQVLRVAIEKRVTGAQLLANYHSYQGVRELFEGEPGFGNNDAPPTDGSMYGEWSKKKNNLLSTEFILVRYYDQVATAVMIDGSCVSDTATRYNPALKSLKARSTSPDGVKRLTGIYTKSSDRGDPFYGVAAHNLGRVPMTIEYCWPEVRDTSTYDPESEVGRLGGLPLMWSGFSTWKEICRNFSMLNNLLYKTATAPIITNIENFADAWGGDYIVAEGDKKAVYLQPPQVQQQIAQVMQRLQTSWDKGTFAPAVSGTGSEASARGTDMVISAGGVRFDHITRKIGRAWSGTLEGIADILRERGGDEAVKIWSFGKKTGGTPFAGKFKAALVGDTSPGISVELKREDAMTDPSRIAVFRSVDGIVPAVVAYDQILEVPDPQGMFDAMRQEKIDTEQTNMAPAVRLGALEKELEIAPKEAKLKWQLQKILDQAQHEMDREQSALDLSQLSEEEVIARQKAFMEQKMQEASTPKGQPGQAGNPFSLQGNSPQPNMPPPQPPSMMPTGAPSGLPPGMMHPSMPFPTPPQAQSGPTMSGPGVPPSGGVSPFANRPPMPMPMPMMQPRPVPVPVPLPPMMAPPGLGLGRRIATAPGQAQQPIQPLSRFQPTGGVGAPGVPARLVGPQGLPGQPVTLNAAIEAANKAVRPVGPLPQPTLGKQKNGSSKRRRAGK